jgi:hypothetical protein
MNNLGLPDGPQVGAGATARLPSSALSWPRYIFAASMMIFGFVGTFAWTIFLCLCVVDLIQQFKLRGPKSISSVEQAIVLVLREQDSWKMTKIAPATFPNSSRTPHRHS